MRPMIALICTLLIGCEAGTEPLEWAEDAEAGEIDETWSHQTGGPIQSHLVIFALGLHDRLPAPNTPIRVDTVDGRSFEALTNDQGRADFYDDELFGVVDVHAYTRLAEDEWEFIEVDSWLGASQRIVTLGLAGRLLDGGGGVPEPLFANVTGHENLQDPREDAFGFAIARLPGSRSFRPSFPSESATVRWPLGAPPNPLQVPTGVALFPSKTWNVAVLAGTSTREGPIEWEDVNRFGIGELGSSERTISLDYRLSDEVFVAFDESDALFDSGFTTWLSSLYLSLPNESRVQIQQVEEEHSAPTTEIPAPSGGTLPANVSLEVDIHAADNDGLTSRRVNMPAQTTDGQNFEASPMVVPRRTAQLRERALISPYPSPVGDIARIVSVPYNNESVYPRWLAVDLDPQSHSQTGMRIPEAFDGMPDLLAAERVAFQVVDIDLDEDGEPQGEGLFVTVLETADR